MRLIDADELLQTVSIKSVFGDEINKMKCGELRKILEMIENAPTVEPQRMRGIWIEKTVAENSKAAGIEEWQSCKCSNCKRYDTRPYLYPFSEPNYCGWCGADMRGNKK